MFKFFKSKKHKTICETHNSKYTHVLITGIPDTTLIFPEVGNGVVSAYSENLICAECIDSINKHTPTVYVNYLSVEKSDNDIKKLYSIKEINHEKD